MANTLINSPVSITSLGFDRTMCAVPRRMEWKGRTYHFIDRGIKATIRRGESIMSTVTVTDGEQEFCLRQTAGQWTLLSVG